MFTYVFICFRSFLELFTFSQIDSPVTGFASAADLWDAGRLPGLLDPAWLPTDCAILLKVVVPLVTCGQVTTLHW